MNLGPWQDIINLALIIFCFGQGCLAQTINLSLGQTLRRIWQIVTIHRHHVFVLGFVGNTDLNGHITRL